MLISTSSFDKSHKLCEMWQPGLTDKALNSYTTFKMALTDWARLIHQLATLIH